MKRFSHAIVFAVITASVFCANAADRVRHMQVRGDKARNLMEALVGAGYSMEAGKDFGQKPITVKTQAITCKYTTATFPDEWMSDAECYQGDGTNAAPVLPNSLSLTKALSAVVVADAALGSRYYGLTGISCVLTYATKAYSCTVSQITY